MTRIQLIRVKNDGASIFMEAPSFIYQLTAGTQMPQVLWVLHVLPERKPPRLIPPPLIFEENLEISLRTKSLLQDGQVTWFADFVLETSSSNVSPHSSQMNSYKGMLTSSVSLLQNV
jgi:hypothetical protein